MLCRVASRTDRAFEFAMLRNSALNMVPMGKRAVWGVGAQRVRGYGFLR